MCTFRCTVQAVSADGSHTLFVLTPFVLQPSVYFGEVVIFELCFSVKSTHKSIFFYFAHISAARKTAILPRHCKTFTGGVHTDGLLFPVYVLELKYVSRGTTF